MLPLIELLDYLPGEEGCVKIVMKALFLGAVLYVLWFVTKDNPPLGIALTVTVLLLMAVAWRYRKRIRLIEADSSAPRDRPHCCLHGPYAGSSRYPAGFRDGVLETLL